MTDIPDPMAVRADTREALAAPDYRDAYDLMMIGAELHEAHVTAIERARELTGTPEPGLPQPIREDVTS